MIRCLTLIAAISVSFFLAGCSGTPDKPLHGNPDEPLWVRKGGAAFPDEKGMIYGVGVAQGIKSLALKRETADERSRADLAKQLEVFIARAMEDYSRSVTELNDASSEEQLVEATGRSFVMQYLVGSRIVDRWNDKQNNATFALARLDLDSADLSNKIWSRISSVVVARIQKNAEAARKRLDTLIERRIQEGVPSASPPPPPEEPKEK